MPVETNILPPRYRGPQRIGRGGMGEIYRATDTSLGRAVAVKVLAARYSEDDAVRERFTREALAAARLSGAPHVVTIFDVGEWNDRPFIVMEYLSGGSLEEELRRKGPPPPGQAVEWLRQAARALDAAHAEGIVHRDVKPANLLLDREGNVHVADFGIASAAGLESLTIAGTVLGTAGYLAPEQARGERAGAASDRYGLGVVAFELLTGSRPYPSETPTAEAMAHVSAPVPRLSERAPSLPSELDAVFERALAKDPAERFDSCAEFVNCIETALEEAAGATQEFAAAPTVPLTRARERTRAAAPVPAAQDAAPYAPRDAAPYAARRRTLWPVLLGAAVLAAAAGVALASVLSGDGDKTAVPTPSTVVTTFATTAEGTTVREVRTVTVPAPAPPPPNDEEPEEEPEEEPPATTAPPPASAASGRELTDQSTSLINAGDYAAALPIAQQALAKLQGTNDIYEAYANYNVGKSLLGQGRCAEALPYFDASEAIQGYRSEIERDRKAAEKCK